jgi:hypothetical protein
VLKVADEIDNPDFWNNYNWNWQSPNDVKQFVDDAIERGVYEYAYGELGDMGSEGYYTTWWLNVQGAIEAIAKRFSTSELNASLEHFLHGDFDECDATIFDAILKYVPGFPKEYPEFEDYIESVMPESGLGDWWEYTWYSLESAYHTSTFWGPETMARSTTIDRKYLSRIFDNSIIAENPYRTFRARVALATNPNCPKEIIEFLWVNRNSQDWLLRDLSCIDPDTYERDTKIGALRFTGSKYEIDESVDNIEEIRQEARETLGFRFPTTEMWESGPGAHYVENLLDIQWEADDARTCLLAAFAKNSSLDEEEYLELFKESHPLIRYFLFNNANVSKDLKTALSLEGSSFTYQPYENPSMYEVLLQLTDAPKKSKRNY